MKQIARRTAIMLILGLVAGCQTGDDRLKGAALRIEFDGLTRSADGLEMSLLVFNPNDHPVLIEQARFDFALEQAPPLTREQSLGLDIAPRNRERIRLRLEAGPEPLALLEALDAGDRSRLAYRLDGELQMLERRPTRIRIEAFLHRVPGQPGRYR